MDEDYTIPRPETNKTWAGQGESVYVEKSHQDYLFMIVEFSAYSWENGEFGPFLCWDIIRREYQLTFDLY